MSALATSANGTGNFMGCIIGSILATISKSKFCLKKITPNDSQTSCDVNLAWDQSTKYVEIHNDFNPYLDTTGKHKSFIKKFCWMGCVNGVPSDIIYLQNNDRDWQDAYTVGFVLAILVFSIQLIAILCFTNPNLKGYEYIEK
jgi:hypothetical protein